MRFGLKKAHTINGIINSAKQEKKSKASLLMRNLRHSINSEPLVETRIYKPKELPMKLDG